MTFGSAFAEGLGVGATRITQGYIQKGERDREFALRQRAADQESEVRGLQIEGMRDQRARDKQVDTAFANYDNISNGLGGDIQSQLRQTYGMTPQQISAATANGGAEGLRSKLATYDTPDNYDLRGDTAAPAMRAADLKTSAPSKRDLLGARRGLAVAQRNTQALAGLEGEGKQLDVDDTFKRMASDPTYRAAKVAEINLNDNRFTVVDAPTDKKGRPTGPSQLIKVGDKGQGSAMNLTPAQENHLLLGLAHMENGSTEKGIALLSGVDKDVADHAAKQFDAQQKAFTANVTAGQRFDTAQYQQGILGVAQQNASTNEWRAANDERRAGAAEARAARGMREVSPETAQKLNDLSVAYENSTDEGERRRIRQQYTLLNAKAATELGKVVGLPEPRQQPELKVNADGTVVRGGQLFVPNHKTGMYERAKGFEPSALDLAIHADAGRGGNGGGLPPRSSAAPAVAPVRPLSQNELVLAQALERKRMSDAAAARAALLRNAGRASAVDAGGE